MGEQTLLRKIPSIDSLAADAGFLHHAEGVSRSVAVDALRAAVEHVRGRLLVGDSVLSDEAALRQAILDRALRTLRRTLGPHYRRVINATGIILHTGLGRAVLCRQAIRQIQEELSGYSLLQVDPVDGRRSRRDTRIEDLLKTLTGAEAATVVNNNAAATMLVLNTIGAGKEIIVSRGQLVEIGGSFRLPEVMAAGGVRLVEVGATNKTHPRDYERAITENTAAILRVHPSNYKIVGFTAEVAIEELVRIARRHHLPLIDDVGAGALIDYSQFGFESRETLPRSVEAGADIIMCSADKLIGASQAGLILGRQTLIESVRKNPLARAFRVGKLTLAALEATLTLFLDEALALSEVPTLAMLRRSPADIAAQAERMVHDLGQQPLAADVEVIDGFSQMGSGSLPGEELPTRLVAVTPGTIDCPTLAERLRAWDPPVFTRIQKDRVLIDPRTLLDRQDEIVVQALRAILQGRE